METEFWYVTLYEFRNEFDFEGGWKGGRSKNFEKKKALCKKGKKIRREAGESDGYCCK